MQLNKFLDNVKTSLHSEADTMEGVFLVDQDLRKSRLFLIRKLVHERDSYPIE